MQDDSDHPPERPDSQLPYDLWTEQALRLVVVRALQHAAAEGLPGEHHLYITFRTDDPRTDLPDRLRAQYPTEMTIVLQHQFWDLKVDEPAARFSVGLSFGGVPSTLQIPLGAITAFADPHAKFGLRFAAEPPPDAVFTDTPTPDTPEPPEPTPTDAAPQVVSLDAFRRRTPPKE